MSDYIAYTPGNAPWLSPDYRTAARTVPNDYRATRELTLLAIGS